MALGADGSGRQGNDGEAMAVVEYAVERSRSPVGRAGSELSRPSLYGYNTHHVQVIVLKFRMKHLLYFS